MMALKATSSTSIWPFLLMVMPASVQCYDDIVPKRSPFSKVSRIYKYERS